MSRWGILCVSFISLSLSAQSTWQRFCDDFMRVMENQSQIYFGSKEASLDFRECVRDVASEMGYHRPIACKKLRFEDCNAYASSHTIWIDEEWFFDLSYEEQDAIIAHEISHIINADYVRMIKAYALWMLTMVGAGFYLDVRFKERNTLQTIRMYGEYAVVYCLLSIALRRYQQSREIAADKTSIELYGQKEGLLQFLHYADQNYRSAIKSIFNINIDKPVGLYEHCVVWYMRLMNTHPEPSVRIQALKEM